MFCSVITVLILLLKIWLFQFFYFVGGFDTDANIARYVFSISIHTLLSSYKNIKIVGNSDFSNLLILLFENFYRFYICVSPTKKTDT